MKPRGDIAAVGRSRAYEYVTMQSVLVHPGGLTIYVYRHKDSGALWAKNVHLDENSSCEVGDWYQVEAVIKTITEYKRVW